MKAIRHYNGAGVAVVGLALIVILAGLGLGIWFLVYEDEIVKVEVSIVDVDLSQDPAPAEIGVRVTSKIDQDVEVKRFTMKVWTDESKEYFVMEETGGNLQVPALSQETWYFYVQLNNIDLIDTSIYIEFSMTHRAQGEDRDVTTTFSGTKSLSDIWEQL